MIGVDVFQAGLWDKTIERLLMDQTLPDVGTADALHGSI